MKNILYIENDYFATATSTTVKLRHNITKETSYFPFEDVSCVIFDSSRSYFSNRFIINCLKNEVLIIYCDEKHMPMASIHGEYGYVRKQKRMLQQIKMSQRAKNRIWQKVIKQKIYNQNVCLSNIHHLSKNQTDLDDIMNDVKLGDSSNRESLAARIYFRTLFGDGFKRYNDDVINSGLNYTYAILRSVIRQNIVRLVLEPSIGIHHASEENPFNLSDDVIECFRPIADAFVYDIIVSRDITEFSLDTKKQLPQILLEQCLVGNKLYYLSDAIRVSCESVVKCIENDNANHIKLPKMIEGGR